MHQIRFPLETPLGELTALPQTPSLYLRGLLLTGGRGEREGKGRGGTGIGSLDPPVFGGIMVGRRTHN